MQNMKSLVILTIGAYYIIVVAGDPIIQLPKGKIRGHILRSTRGQQYYAFQQIPYAAPPTGINRFKLPKEPQPWSGILNTTKNTVVCSQLQTKFKDLKKSEDCLYINVYTPMAPRTSQLFPVLVWIHGGGFVNESAGIDYYNPKHIIDHRIVVVTLEYRLGPFGFLTTEDEVIPPNLGLKDQLFALEWVHENIGLFGGNKSRVTIAGESAGSIAIGWHLLGPWQNKKALYHAAILQSGSPLFFRRGNNAREEAFNLGHILNDTFYSKDSKDLLKVLQNVSALDILKVSPYQWPIMENDGQFKYQMYDCLENENFKKIPIIIGFTSEECMLSKCFYPEGWKKIAEAYDKNLSLLMSDAFNISAVNRSTAGYLVKKIYTTTSFRDNISALIKYKTDNIFTTAILKQAELQSKYTDVYLYQFSYKGKLGRALHLPFITGSERVAHTEELKYLWDYEENSNILTFPAADRLLLHRFVKLWANFVKYHNPTPKEDPFLQKTIWPKVDPNQPENMQYMNINISLEIRSNPRYYQKIKKVLDYIITSKDVILN